MPDKNKKRLSPIAMNYRKIILLSLGHLSCDLNSHALAPLLPFLAAAHGFDYRGVKIQPSCTRWGSCSARRDINLSYYLMLVPPHLADYVMLHELCHTREMNHSPRFWALLDQFTGGKAHALREELKRYRCSL